MSNSNSVATVTKAKTEIQQAREVLQPSPVTANQVPRWLHHELQRAMKDGRLAEVQWMFPNASYITRCEAMEFLTRHLGSSCDHPGITMIGKQQAFVAEPYHVDSHVFAMWQSFASRIGCRFFCSSNSWHYPGRTFRLALVPEEAES